MGTLSNIRVNPCQVFWGSTNLGYTEGDLTPKINEKMHMIKAHETGANQIGAIRVGKTCDISINLQETSVAQVKTLLAAGGVSAVTNTGVAEVFTVTCLPDVSGSLNNKYFLFGIAEDATKYYCWLNVNSAGTDPAISGRTGVPVAVATSATAATIASAVQAAIDALAGSVATVSGAVVTVTNATVGGCSDAVDGNTGFTVAVTTQGVGAIPGWGTSRDFTEVSADCQKLVLHPVVKSSTDQSEDICFWKAYPAIESIKIAAESQQLVVVKFEIFPDYDRAAAIRWFGYGAHL